jgi:hypothetical protein
MWTHGGVHAPLSTYVSESVVAGSIHQPPSWDALDSAAFSLALSGPVEPVDLVVGIGANLQGIWSGSAKNPGRA